MINRTNFSLENSSHRTWEKPAFFADPKFVEIGQKYNKSSAQLTLRYLVCQTCSLSLDFSSFIFFLLHDKFEKNWQQKCCRAKVPMSTNWPHFYETNFPGLRFKSAPFHCQSRPPSTASKRTSPFSTSNWPPTSWPTSTRSTRANAYARPPSRAITRIFHSTLSSRPAGRGRMWVLWRRYGWLTCEFDRLTLAIGTRTMIRRHELRQCLFGELLEKSCTTSSGLLLLI